MRGLQKLCTLLLTSAIARGTPGGDAAVAVEELSGALVKDGALVSDEPYSIGNCFAGVVGHGGCVLAACVSVCV